MDLRFEQPLWLWLTLASVPLAVVGLIWFRAMSPGRRITAVVARAVLVALIALLLAGASSVRRTQGVSVIVVADVSGSVERYVPAMRWADGVERGAGESMTHALERLGMERGAEDLLGVVSAEASPRALAMPTRATIGRRELRASDASGTDLAAGLRLARAIIPAETTGRIVLVSDGRQTRGDVLAAAREVALAGGRVDVVPLAYNLVNEVVVESVDAPAAASAESVVTLRIALRAGSASTGTLRVEREGAVIDLDPAPDRTGRGVALAPGLNIEQVQVRLPPGRVHRFGVTFEPDVLAYDGAYALYAGDTILENNSGGAFTMTPGRGAVLLVDGVGLGEEGAGSPLAGVWREAGLDVVVVPPGGVPAGLLDLERYDLVVLENVPADSMPEASQEQLVRFVQDMGGGLAIVGGPGSLAAGGWKGSILEPILPVLLDLPQRLIVPETATVFVIDNSGSMRRFVLGSSRSQQEIANDATALAIRALDKRDLVGVITFNNVADVVVELGPNTNAADASDRVRDIRPGGGTNAYPAIELAREQLCTVSHVKNRHLVVLSDGKSRKDAQLPALCAALAGEGIRVSTIAVGDDASLETMAKMAAQGEGAYYHALNPDMLPQIFLKAVRVVRSPLVREEPFTPEVEDATSPLLAGVGGMGGLPELGGLSLASIRPEPAVQNALLTPEGEPVLSHWNAGAGRVVVFTSDAHRWGARWAAWDGYRGMWTQIARYAARASDAGGMSATAIVEGARVRVRVEAVDESSRPRQGLQMPATLYAPSGEATELRLTQIAPGVYEGESPLREEGHYVALVRPASEGERFAPVVVGASSPKGSEFAFLRSDDALLAEVARVGGGRVWNLEDLRSMVMFDRAGLTPREAWIPLRRSLLLWTLAVLLIDIATRRVAWDRWTSGRFAAKVTHAIAADAALTLEALRERAGGMGAGAGSAGIGASGDLALGEREARALAEAARDRRRKERLRARASTPRTMSPQAPGDDSEPTLGGVSRADVTKTPAPVDGEDDTPLKAAKRRARERFDQES